MPKYAIVAVVDASQAELAWEAVCERLLNDDPAECVVAYVGAPWLVPEEPARGSVEYGTDAIRLEIDGRCVDLSPAD